MPNLISYKRVTARKTHLCDTCGHPAVHPGEEYRRDVYVYDGRIYTWVSCTDCNGIAAWVYAWAYRPDEGVGQEEYIEWAHEHMAGDDEKATAARAYLERTGSLAALQAIGEQVKG